jgi:hypothetical protein
MPKARREGGQFALYSKRSARFLAGRIRFVVRRKTAVAFFPVQTHLREPLLVDPRLAARTTSLWLRQRSGDAEDMPFPFSGQERFWEEYLEVRNWELEDRRKHSKFCLLTPNF